MYIIYLDHRTDLIMVASTHNFDLLKILYGDDIEYIQEDESFETALEIASTILIIHTHDNN